MKSFRMWYRVPRGSVCGAQSSQVVTVRAGRNPELVLSLLAQDGAVTASVLFGHWGREWRSALKMKLRVKAGKGRVEMVESDLRAKREVETS